MRIVCNECCEEDSRDEKCINDKKYVFSTLGLKHTIEVIEY